MSEKFCKLCKRSIFEGEEALNSDGEWAHAACITLKLERMKKSGVNPEVIDFIINKFKANPPEQKKRKFWSL